MKAESTPLSLFAVLCAVLTGCLAVVALPTPARAQGVGYTVTLTGVEGDLRDLIEASSRLESGTNTPPPGIAGLYQRADADRDSFQEVLRSQGYYGATVQTAVDSSTSPAKVAITIDSGPLFRFGACTIDFMGAPPPGVPRACPALGLAPHAPAVAATVLLASGKLRTAFLQNGHPDLSIMRRAVVDHATGLMNLTFTVMPGPAVHLGPVMVHGNQRVRADFLERLKTWKLGDLYDTRVLDKYRDRLNGLNLFDSVTVSASMGQNGSDGRRPVEVDVHERAPRTIGGGVRYATSEGFGIKAFWEHRDLFGRAERLHIDVAIAELAQSVALTYSLPHRPEVEQRLDFTLSTTHETTDAYSKLGGEASAGISSPLGGLWRGKVALDVQGGRLTDVTGPRTTMLVSLPVEASYDSTDSVLDPTKGEKLLLRATPVAGQSDGATSFLKLEADGSIDRVLAGGGLVGAARLKLGTILGASASAIPADWRFYAGGGGSVRGYGYQQIGPRGAKNTPLGGRSVVEGGIEVRQRIIQTFGAAAFVEGASLGHSLVGFSAPRYGAGVGVRYYTAVGPIRADVAVPLNPRPGDASFQIYLSIGQAF